MKVMKSYRFLGDKTEMAGVVADSNEECVEYAQASGSFPRMRACEEGYAVCSSLPRSLSAESEFDTGVKGGSPETKSMMIHVLKMLHNVFLMRASYMSINRMDVQQAVKEVISEQRYEKAPHVDTYIVLCFDHENV